MHPHAYIHPDIYMHTKLKTFFDSTNRDNTKIVISNRLLCCDVVVNS
ncbi:hypothetical protein [Plasmodium yoelii yoelii]|uniref:Uncharacterized protein n=1 Tax=Plasmodium yoelii yoelii TaxID=73239 RepID=Q7RM80_PLAYO|nr:hypothetical protein [Plasmodium yoelii yoelii]